MKQVTPHQWRICRSVHCDKLSGGGCTAAKGKCKLDTPVKLQAAIDHHRAEARKALEVKHV